MARKRPVISWVIRQRPRSEPKFHQVDRLIVVGRSTTAAVSGLKRGFVLRRGLYILVGFERS